MKVVNMVVGQASGLTCPRVVSRSCCNSNLQQQPVLLWSAPLFRMDSSVRLVRPSCNIGLSSSGCMLPGSPYIKSGKEYSTALGKLWQRRIYKGRIRCQLGGTSSSQEDEIGSDANVQSTLGENDTVQFDLDLPRRSLLLEFTCNVCQARTQRMINPDALRRGTVYVQEDELVSLLTVLQELLDLNLNRILATSNVAISQSPDFLHTVPKFHSPDEPGQATMILHEGSKKRQV